MIIKMEYLKLFGTHQNYEEYVSGGTMAKPNVSLCEQENEVHYNPYIRPNLCYRRIGSYYVLCANDGRLHRTGSHDVYYLGWNSSGTKVFHNMSATGNWSVISGTVATYGTVGDEIQFSTAISNGTEYLVNDTFTWEGTSYVFSNGTWTPSIPGGQYIDPDETYEEK